jgi:hypothetical protein
LHTILAIQVEILYFCLGLGVAPVSAVRKCPSVVYCVEKL